MTLYCRIKKSLRLGFSCYIRPHKSADFAVVASAGWTIHFVVISANVQMTTLSLITALQQCDRFKLVTLCLTYRAFSAPNLPVRALWFQTALQTQSPFNQCETLSTTCYFCIFGAYFNTEGEEWLESSRGRVAVSHASAPISPPPPFKTPVTQAICSYSR